MVMCMDVYVSVRDCLNEGKILIEVEFLVIFGEDVDYKVVLDVYIDVNV